MAQYPYADGYAAPQHAHQQNYAPQQQYYDSAQHSRHPMALPPIPGQPGGSPMPQQQNLCSIFAINLPGACKHATAIIQK